MANSTSNLTWSISSLSYSLIKAEKILSWFMISFVAFGIISNLFNCLVFLQKPLLSNPCSFYLLISSIINIPALIFAIVTGIYAEEQVNPTSYLLAYCKLRLYLYHTLLMISRYLIILACIDRACLSSRRVSIRNFSQIKFAHVLSLTIIIFWFLAAIHIPIFTTIQNGYCLMPGIYNLIFSIYAVIVAGILPPVLMSIFSLITIRHLHSIRVHIHATRNQRDFHLTRMLIAQVVVYVLTTTPYPLNTVYLAITLTTNKSFDRQVIEGFVYFLTGSFLLFLNPTVPFYIYLTTSKAFRMEFKSAWIHLYQKVSGKQRANTTTNSNNGIKVLTRTMAQ